MTELTPTLKIQILVYCLGRQNQRPVLIELDSVIYTLTPPPPPNTKKNKKPTHKKPDVDENVSCVSLIE